MKRSTIATLCFCLTPILAFAQQRTLSSLSTTVPNYAKYEIVQSPLLARLTIRLDRFTGETWQFVNTAKKSFAWQLMPRISMAHDEKIPGKVNYQIFVSGIRAQITILMNTNTGTSWYIVEDPKAGDFWTPMQ
ncbi:MAG: hypothetical protein EPN62_00175 [Candidimonas sp.]|nr:MAG: hypothetical protein EPN62_00175 [Candidimonas sp.]